MSAVNLSDLLQTKIKTYMTSCEDLINESKAIENTYFKSGASTDISALAGSDPVTVSTKLTKDEMTNGITLVQQVDKFFQNSAVTQSDYLGSVYPIVYGNNEATAIVSTAVEALGERLKNLCDTLVTQWERGRDIIDLYFDNEFGDVVAVLDSHRIIYGSDMTQSDLSSAVTLIQEFQDLLQNAAVTTANYSETVAKWRRY